MSRKPFVIGDPVHSYLGVGAHERLLVDHSVTQRLRNISQTGFAQFVFPESRTARFSHSLGAMHLASRFLCACIENAERVVQEHLLEQVDAIFEAQAHAVRSAGEPATTLEEMDLLSEGGGNAGVGSSASRLVWLTDKFDADKRRRLVVFVEGGLRLAALFHDVGHLPFSHDFEKALQSYVNENGDAAGDHLRWLVNNPDSMPPHEVIGHRLAEIARGPLLADCRASGDKSANAIRAILTLAKDILHASPPADSSNVPFSSVTQWLHSLVDGDVDVDRADYLKRDGRNLGADFGRFDLDRLAANLVVAHTPRLGFCTAVRGKALAALEAYLIARARSLQLMVHHHKVAEVGLAFQFATKNALKAGLGDELLDYLSRLANGQLPALLDEYARFDDVWWLTRLREFHRRPNLQPLVTASLDVVLRRKPALQAVWKRAAELAKPDRARWNRLFDDKNYFNREVREHFEQRGLLAIPHKFEPFKMRPVAEGSDRKEAAVHVISGTSMTPLDQYSTSAASLGAWWDDDVHFHLYGLAQDPAELRRTASAALDWWERKVEGQEMMDPATPS